MPAAAQEAPASAGPAPAALIEDLVVANRILSDRGILDAFGHVSVRHPENPTRYLMARAIAPGLVTAADIMEFDLDSNPVDRRGRSMFIERFIHGEIYKVRPDVDSVIHTHSMGVIPFSITKTAAAAGDPQCLVPARGRAGVGNPRSRRRRVEHAGASTPRSANRSPPRSATGRSP